MKKVFSFITVVILIATFSITSQAKPKVTKEDYLANYAQYKDYYTTVYVPSYGAYNQALSDLAAEIKAAEFTTSEQAQRVIDFLKDLKNRKNTFFGDRITAGTSRNIVPTLRESMYAAAKAENYSSAYTYCNDLTAAVEARVDFLKGLTDEINSFEVIVSEEPAAADVSISFTVNSYSPWWYSYTMVITNNSDAPIENWTLQLAVNGDINYANLSSKGYDAFGKYSKNGGYTNTFSTGVFTLSPSDQWQSGYVIPTGATLTFVGGGASINGITGATINGIAADVSFVK